MLRYSYEFPDEVVLIIIEGWSIKACSEELRGKLNSCIECMVKKYHINWGGGGGFRCVYKPALSYYSKSSAISKLSVI